MTKGAKWKALLVALLSCLLLTAILYPITLPVEKQLSGMICSVSDKTETEPVQVSIRGQIYWKLFGADDTQVNLQVYRQNGENLSLTLADTKGTSYDYYDDEGKTYSVKGNLNYLPFGKSGEMVLLAPTAAEWELPAYCLVIPATDRDSALAIIQKNAPEIYDAYANGRIVQAK